LINLSMNKENDSETVFGSAPLVTLLFIHIFFKFIGAKIEMKIGGKKQLTIGIN